MSIELYIFINDSLVPSRDEWQAAIDGLGFPAELDPTLDVRNDSGFSPTHFRGQSTGFEFNIEPSADIVSSYPHIAPQIGDRDICAAFRWGGDLAECGAAISAAAALAKLADGIYYYPDNDILYDASEAVAATERDLASF